MISSTNFDIFSESDLSSYVDKLSSYLNFCFDICCPVETLFIRASNFSSPYLKQLRRKKEFAYKHSMASEVKRLTELISTEIHRLNEIYTKTLLGSTDCRDVWKVLKQLTGINSKAPTYSDDLNALNKQFIHDAQLTSSSTISADRLPIVNIQPHSVFQALKSLKASKAPGPDNVSPMLLKHCADILYTPIANLFSCCLTTGAIAENWRTVRITPVPKKSVINGDQLLVLLYY